MRILFKQLILSVLVIGFVSGCTSIVGHTVPFAGNYIHHWYANCHWCGARCWDTTAYGKGIMTKGQFDDWVRSQGGIGDDGHYYCSARCMSATGANVSGTKEVEVPRNQ